MTLSGETERVFFRTKDAPLAESVEAFAGIALVPCMATGNDCLLDRPVSAKWLAGVAGIQSTLSSWVADFAPIRLAGASPRSHAVAPGRGVGALFSGGVDSFYTVLKHKDEITDLVLMHGFDMRLDNHATRERVSATLRETARALGKRFIEVETNVRSFSDRWASLRWTYGALLAGVAHVLSPVLGRMYIPSSGGGVHVSPWGSHPDLDPLWSTETLEILHDGCEVDRAQKTACIAQSEIALQSLRVCWRSRDGEYNCGRCEKCLRTMISLYAVGALERCRTFPPTLSPRRVYQIKLRLERARLYSRQNLEALEAKGLNPRLCMALRRLAYGRGRGGKWRGTFYWLLDSFLWSLGRRPGRRSR